MPRQDILGRLGSRKITADEGAEIVLKDPKLLRDIFKGVSSENKRIKNATGKILRTVSEKYPEKLYPRFDFFIDHMDGDDTILKWLAMDTIANMAPVDKKNKIKKMLKKYYAYLSDESMITAGHAVDSLGVIAKYRPEFSAEITRELFKIKSIKRGAECRNILLGKVILAYGGYVDNIKNKNEVIKFVEKETENKRSGTAKKARVFLEKVDK